jgi:hypothetical protein
MSKITVSTVKQTADVQVLYVNAYLISKVIRAQVEMESLLCPNRQPVPETDDEGDVITDENGNIVIAKDENGNEIYSYCSRYAEPQDLEALDKKVLSLLNELAKAFEE